MKHVVEQLIFRAIKEILGQESDIESLGLHFVVSVPPSVELGDYASNAGLILSRKLQQKGKEGSQLLAERIVEKMKLLDTNHIFKSITAVGGFINVHLSPGAWFKEVLAEISKQKSEFGKIKAINPENIMVEYLSPNTNKPLHLGHLRNGVIGVAVSNMLKSQGHHVTKVGIINDRGVHICKAMLAYQRWGNGATPESTGKKPDNFVGEWYVQFAQEAAKNAELENEAQEMLRKWEEGNPEIRKLWETLRNWVIEGWKQTEDVLGFKYDKPYFESEVYQLGKDIVEQGLEKGVFRKNEKGNVVFELSAEEFGKDEDGNPRVITVLRPDGTSLYTTQDLGLAVQRAKEFNLDRLVFVVASEQRFHFQSLFAMLKALGYAWAGKLHHLWYGMVYLPEGKMKSREGTVIDADDLVMEMMELARKEIDSRSDRADGKKENDEVNGMERKERGERARVIALAAIKFYMLRIKTTTDITFDPKESISFEGFTGPYCLYTYARARSILRAAGVMSDTIVSEQSPGLANSPEPGSSNESGFRVPTSPRLRRASKPGMTQVDYSVLGNEDERQLLIQLETFPEVIKKSAEQYDPSQLSTYIFKTAQTFNQFYGSSPVLKAESQVAVARLQLVEAASTVLQNGLHLLGIETLEEM